MLSLCLALLLVAQTAPLSSPSPTPPSAVRTLTVEQVAAWRQCDKRLHIIDNDPYPMHVRKHVPGAVWLNYREIREGSLPADKATPLLFYCYSER